MILGCTGNSAPAGARRITPISPMCVLSCSHNFFVATLEWMWEALILPYLPWICLAVAGGMGCGAAYTWKHPLDQKSQYLVMCVRVCVCVCVCVIVCAAAGLSWRSQAGCITTHTHTHTHAHTHTRAHTHTHTHAHTSYASYHTRQTHHTHRTYRAHPGAAAGGGGRGRASAVGG